jgi:hypothetical protein
MAFNDFPMAQRRSAIATNGFPSAPARCPRRHSKRLDPRRFGRGRIRVFEDPQPQQQHGWRLSDDLRLFASSFVAGFVFVAIMVA